MKSLVRNTAVNALSLFFASQLLLGLQVQGGIPTFLIGGLALSFMFIIRPILSIITLPLNLITFGIFSFLINALILYILTIFVPEISVVPFTFPGISFGGFTIPKLSFNLFFAFIVSSAVLSFIISAIKWIIKD